MLLAKNKKAYYNYEIIDKFLAGVVLKGYEVKACREKKINLEAAFVKVTPEGIFLVNMDIGRYSKQSQPGEDNKRIRKLLVTGAEQEKIERELNQKGKTAVPLAVLLKSNMIKVEIAIVKGKKAAGKKQTLKERQIKRDMEKEVKSHSVV
jgi:SsrA-binding protein